MKESELFKVEDGLNILLAKFLDKPNLQHKVAAIQDAKSAIRKVILSVAIKGNFKNITPHFDPKYGIGWKVIDEANTITYFYNH